jgi:cyclic pyranopterin phosphate synthase
MNAIPEQIPLIDPFNRQISYLRLSVTDRCDLRCSYCMDEGVRFVPKREVLSLEELKRLAGSFIALGVRKVRITGGEPLVRRNVMALFEELSRYIDDGSLDELTLTSNATQLARFARQLTDYGVRRINISLDTRDPQRFRELTRIGRIEPVMQGIDAALTAGLKVKLNMVVIEGFNDQEVPDMMRWAHGRGMDLTLIEVMPFGDGEKWLPSLIPLTDIRKRLEEDFTLTELDDKTGGPARYVEVKETGGRLGFITPLSGNFCTGCNRVRVTCRGRLYQCLGREQYVDLRQVLRDHENDADLQAAIRSAIGAKPEGHDFEERLRDGTANAKRTMAATGG